MLQWSPDTTDPARGGGYSASSTEITGFSLTHMSGPGCRSGGDVPVLPTVGAIKPTTRDFFRHSRQTAAAGYYSVHLANGIHVRLTATTRTGLAEFSFPPGHGGNLIFKLNGFVEGDSWQYTGMVPFDVAGLAAAKGGRAAMARYLRNVLAGFRAGDRGTVANMSNEPSIELPWEYDYIGRPYDAQQTVRRIQDQLWRNAPGGIPGNDDLGAMSAWFVWSALGMYPMTPGTATLALGSPLFSRAAIELPSGTSLQIIGSRAGTSRPYVRSATWNSAPWTRAYAPAGAITGGGTLDFHLGRSPGRGWAARPGHAPPSYGA